MVPAGGGVQVHYMRTYLFPWINTTNLISLSNCPAVVCCQSFHPFRMGFHPNDTSAYLVFFLPLNIPVMLFAAECGAELCCSVDQVVPSVSILMVLQPQVPQGSLQVAVWQLYSLSFGCLFCVSEHLWIWAVPLDPHQVLGTEMDNRNNQSWGRGEEGNAFKTWNLKLRS